MPDTNVNNKNIRGIGNLFKASDKLSIEATDNININSNNSTFLKNIKISGDTHITGNTQLSNDTSIQGDTINLISSEINIGPVSITGEFFVNGKAPNENTTVILGGKIYDTGGTMNFIDTNITTTGNIIANTLDLIGSATFVGDTLIGGNININEKNLATEEYVREVIIEKIKNVSGISNVSDTRIISGNTTFNNNLNITGELSGTALTINEPSIISGNTIITGNTQVNSNIIITGKLTGLSLDISGAAIISDNIAISGDTQMIGNITSSKNITGGDIYINDSVDILGDTIISGNTKITGNITSKKQLEGQSLHISEESNIDGFVTISDNILVGGGIYSAKKISGQRLDITGPVIIADDTTIVNDTNIVGTLNVGGTIKQNGVRVLTIDDISVITGGASSIKSENGITTIENPTNITANLGFSGKLSGESLNILRETDILGSVTISGNAEVIGNITATGKLTGTKLDISESTNIWGNTIFSENLETNSDIMITNKISGKTLEISDTTVIQGNATISGTTEMTGDITSIENIIASTLELSGETTISGETTLEGDAFVTRNVYTTGNINGESLDILGLTELLGHTTISGNTQITGNIISTGQLGGDSLNVYGESTISDNVTITGDIISTNQLEGVSLYTSGSTDIVGNTTVSGTITVMRDIITDKILSGGQLNIDGSSTLSSNTKISGITQLEGSIFALDKIQGSSLNIEGPCSVTGGTTIISGTSIITGDISVSNKIYIGGSEIATESYVESPLKGIDGVTTIIGNTNISSNTNITGNLIMDGHIIPSTSNSFDLGLEDKKIRHIHLSSGSLWIGDDNKVGENSLGNVKTMTRKKTNDYIPRSIRNAIPEGNKSGALAHSSKSNLEDLTLSDWLSYGKTLNISGKGIGNAVISDIFSADEDFEEDKVEIVGKEMIGDDETFINLPPRYGTSHKFAYDGTTDTTYFTAKDKNFVGKINSDGTIESITGNTTITSPCGIDIYPKSDQAISALVTSSDGFVRKLDLDSESDNIAVTNINKFSNIVPATGNINITTHAGARTGSSGPSATWVDGDSETSRFKYPYGIATDNEDNIFVADKQNHRIRKITGITSLTPGTVSTIAGGGEGVREDGGAAGVLDAVGKAAMFNTPTDVAIDNEGNIFVVDKENHRIRKITGITSLTPGTVSTIAGGQAGFLDGIGNAAKFHNPEGIVIDSDQNLYIADSFNNSIRKITRSMGEYHVTTIAGNPSFPGYTTTSNLNNMGRFADSKNLPSSFSITGPGHLTFTTYAGIITSSTPHGFTDYPTPVTISVSPGSFSPLSSDIVYYAYPFNGAQYTKDKSIRLHHWQSDMYSIPIIFTEDLKSNQTLTITPHPRLGALFYKPIGLDIDSLGNILVADHYNGKIRKIELNGIVSTLVNATTPETMIDDNGERLLNFRPNYITIDESDSIFASHRGNKGISKFVKGTNPFYWQKVSFIPQNLHVANRPVADIPGITLDGNGNILVANSFNHNIRLITNAADKRVINNPHDIVIHPNGNSAYVSLEDDHTIHKLEFDTLNGTTTVNGSTIILGQSGISGHKDSTGLGSTLNTPKGLELYPRDNPTDLLIADSGNHIVRSLELGNNTLVKTIAGTPGIAGNTNSTGLGSSFNNPTDINVALDNTVYIMDQSYKKIRSLTNITGVANERMVNTLPFERSSNTETGILIKDANSLYIDNPPLSNDSFVSNGKISKINISNQSGSNKNSLITHNKLDVHKTQMKDMVLDHLTTKKNIISEGSIECNNLNVTGEIKGRFYDKLKELKTKLNELKGILIKNP